MTQGPFGVHKQSDLVILYFLCAKTSAAIILELELSEGLEYSVLFVSVFCWRTCRVKKDCCLIIYAFFSLPQQHTGDSRWLELRSLEVKLRSRFFSLYNKANLLPISRTSYLSEFSISRTKPRVPLHTFHCFSLSISRSLDCKYTLANQACNKHTLGLPIPG